MPGHRSIVRPVLSAALVASAALLLVVTAAFAYAWIAPQSVPECRPNPARTYAEAVARIEADRRADPASVRYHQLFIGQGSRTATAVVLFHGFTNNPRQMERLAKAYAATGCNVYVPRMPHHGLADRMTDDLARANRRELIAWTSHAIDIGAGLGDHVVVSGLSAGGTLSAWAAVNRSEVSEAVLVAPLVRAPAVPEWLVKPIYQLTPVLPPIWMWWNSAKKEQQKAPESAYPRYTLSALGDFLAVADGLAADKPERKGQLRCVVVITNQADTAVRNDVALALLRKVLRPLTNQWTEYAIPASHAWKHDLIDPLGENVGHADDIYRTILPMYGLPSTETPVGFTSGDARAGFAGRMFAGGTWPPAELSATIEEC